MKVSPLRVVVSLLLWLALMSSLACFYLWSWLHADHQIPTQHSYFMVNKGESLKSVAWRLHQDHIIRWPNVWCLYSRWLDPGSIKAGEYQFARRESPISILDKLQVGDVILHQVTLVEGKNFEEWVTQLQALPKLQSLLHGQPLAKQLELLDLPITHPEGWFFPDTYQYVAGDSDLDVMRRAYTKMHGLLMAAWPERANGLPYQEPYDALIMASIIEKETGVASERAEIAGVFVRRLQKTMRLQTDPTVVYGLGSSFEGNLSRAHLAQDNPYNTYTRFGLPPTPIAMPGADAIHASLHPLDGDTLYFVAKGDGSHHFSATLTEHNNAVRKYQQSHRVKDYRSSPALKSVDDAESR